jgi:hypothetical protein
VDKYCAPYREYLLKAICAKTYDPLDIALALNTYWRKSDEAKELFGRTYEEWMGPYADRDDTQDIDDLRRLFLRDTTGWPSERTEHVVYQDVKAEVYREGFLPVRSVQAGCGISAGFTIGAYGIEQAFSNSVAMFADGAGDYSGENADKDPNLCVCKEESKKHFHCPGTLRTEAKDGRRVAEPQAVVKERGVNHMKQEECEVCFKIVCRQCKWEPNEKELLLIQQGKLTACPVCGWVPGT